ncbi:MAG: Cna B-type domain-containing protein [Eubacteriaceae bacterium]|jgi:hypothetical protein|nr:Cna B-type domain-containing protein [Eubacteriaceae bacterium]
MGGGIYGGLGAKPNLKLSNMAVYSNTASSMGGGLYSCPTGRIYLYGKNGGAVFGNKSDTVGDDISAERTMYKSDATTSYTTLSNSMLGGGIVHYYNDGVPVMSTTVNNVDNYSPTGARYNALDPGDEVTPNESTTPYLLKAVATKDAEKMAEDAASLKITNNSAGYGGGIATNASLTIGEKDKVWNLNVSKTWSGNKAKPASVTVDLIYGGKVIDTLKLSAKNNWKGTFKNLAEVMKGKVSISEESVSGWTASVGGITAEKDGTDQSVTITNTESVTPPTPTPTAGTITVTKKTLNQSGQAVKVSGTFYITLFSDEKCTKIVGQTQSVAVRDGVPGTATFTGLATGKYYAAETNADGTKLITEPAAAGKYVGYDVTGNGTAVTLSAENPSGTAVITNVYSPAGHKTPKTPTNPKTPTTPTTPTTPASGTSQTGDNFNVGLWTLLAVLGLTGITVPVWFRRKRG